MTSIIRLAMIVLMARRDLRFFSIRFFAHFAGFILSSSLQCFLCRAARLRLGSSSQTSQRALTIKPHCFSRPFSSVPTSAVHSDQVPALGSDRFVTVPDSAEGSCLPDDSSSNAGEASHGYEVGVKKSTPWLNRRLSQVRRGQNDPKFLVVYHVGKLEPLIEKSSSLFTRLYAIKLFASIFSVFNAMVVILLIVSTSPKPNGLSSP